MMLIHKIKLAVSEPVNTTPGFTMDTDASAKFPRTKKLKRIQITLNQFANVPHKTNDYQAPIEPHRLQKRNP